MSAPAGSAGHPDVLDISDPRWRAFVEAHPQATPFHHPAWAQLVADCYGFRAFALTESSADGRIVGGVPVVEVRHVIGQRRWVSLPFTDACEPLLAPGTPPLQLRDAFAAALTRSGAASLELRGTLEGTAATGAAALGHTLRLEADADAIHERFHARVRRAIRQAERAGLQVRIGASQSDLVETFFALHVQTRRRLGVPVQPRRFFRLVWDRMIAAGLGSVILAEADGRAIGGLVLLHWGSTTVYKFGASDADSWRLRPNHLLMWHAIRGAAEAGYRRFDFGRTDVDTEGLREFKRSWGSDEHDLR